MLSQLFAKAAPNNGVEDVQRRAQQAQLSAGCLLICLIIATLVRPAVADLNWTFSLLGVGNSLIAGCIYWLIASGRAVHSATAILMGGSALMLLPLLAISGGSTSQYTPLIPLFPLFAMLLSGVRLCLTCAVGWVALVGADMLLPGLSVDLTGEPLDTQKNLSRGMWIIMATLMSTTFALQVQHSLTQLRQKLEQQATIDALTGVLNRRGLDQGMNAELMRASRAQTPLSALLIDIDEFKKFNDQFGHNAGDRCLQMVARVLQRQVRTGQDLVGRFGGEEFILMLGDCDANQARRIAEKLRSAINRLAVEVADGFTAHTSATIGCATLATPIAQITDEPMRSALAQDLVRRADLALYKGKAEGRNQVISG